MSSFSFLPTSADAARIMEGHTAVPHSCLDQPQQLPSPEQKACDALHWAKAVEAVTQRYVADGDVVIKSVFCRSFYGAVLLESGTLLLVAPNVPDQHGKPLMPQDAHSDDEAVVVDVSAGDAHIVFCTLSGAVYTLGYDNAYGQLGNGTVWRMPTPVRDQNTIPPLTSPQRVPGFGYSHNTAASIVSDKMMTTAVADESTLRSTATRTRVSHGTEGGATWYAPLNPSVEVLAEMHQRGAPKRKAQASDGAVLITSVACGAEHTLLLTLTRNAVYACGRGHCGQLSGSRMVPAQPAFRSISLLFGLPINSIAAAGHHSFVLLRTGRLFAFGDNTCGQLGLGHTEKVIAPTPVTFLDAHRCDHKSGDDDVKLTPNPNPAPSQGGPSHSPSTQSPQLATIITPRGPTALEEYVAPNGTVVSHSRPSVQSMSLGSLTTAPHGGAPRTRAREALLDAKTFHSLRAPYNSVESTQFPLRVMRLSADLEPGEEAITAVYTTEGLTIVCTASLEWFSCGLPLSVGVINTREGRDRRNDHHGGAVPPPSPSSAATMPARADRRGPLGRALKTLPDAYRFGRMLWPPELTEALVAVQQAAQVSSAHRYNNADNNLPEGGSAAAEENSDAIESPSTTASTSAKMARSRRATEVPVVEVRPPKSGPPRGQGAVTSACHTGRPTQLSASLFSAASALAHSPVACICYGTLVAVAVRVPQEPQTLKLFVLASQPTALLDIHVSGVISDTATAASSVVPAGDPRTPVASEEVAMTTPKREDDCPTSEPQLILNTLAPVRTRGESGEEQASPTRLPETVSDAVMYCVCAGPSAVLAMPNGVLFM